ncbi:MAG: hypothetical protein MK116_03665 [Phycisphaerales bacterium]|nr:hypothetical protein [Phycisphaerales bacterium]
MTAGQFPNPVTTTPPPSAEVDCGACPRVDQSLRECRSHFQLRSIEQAMATCFGDWSSCPIYKALSRRGSEPSREQPVGVILTVRQQTHVELRPTGS